MANGNGLEGSTTARDSAEKQLRIEVAAKIKKDMPEALRRKPFSEIQARITEIDEALDAGDFDKVSNFLTGRHNQKTGIAGVGQKIGRALGGIRVGFGTQANPLQQELQRLQILQREGQIQAQEFQQQQRESQAPLQDAVDRAKTAKATGNRNLLEQATNDINRLTQPGQSSGQTLNNGLAGRAQNIGADAQAQTAQAQGGGQPFTPQANQATNLGDVTDRGQLVQDESGRSIQPDQEFFETDPLTDQPSRAAFTEKERIKRAESFSVREQIDEIDNQTANLQGLEALLEGEPAGVVTGRVARTAGALTGGNVNLSGELARQFTPSISAGIYRSFTGDKRLSNVDAAARAMPLVPQQSDSARLQKFKVAFLRLSFNDRRKRLSRMSADEFFSDSNGMDIQVKKLKELLKKKNFSRDEIEAVVTQEAISQIDGVTLQGLSDLGFTIKKKAS